MKNKILTIGAGVALIAGATVAIPNEETLIKWDKPNTDKEWREDIKKESLQIYDIPTLEKLYTTHKPKLDEISELLKVYQDCPECVRYYKEQVGVSPEDIDNQIVEDIKVFRWKKEKLEQSLIRIEKAIELKK